MSETQPIFCAECRVEAKVIVDANDQSPKSVICPVCGHNDSLESAMRDVGEYLVRKAMREAFGGLPEGGAITVEEAPERRYRFVPE